MATESRYQRRSKTSAAKANNASGPGNAAALDASLSDSHGPTGSSYQSATKRSEAALLAQELGSSGPWSESFISQTTGTSSASHTEQQTDNTQSEDTLDRSNYNPMTHRDLDPPPAYSRVPEAQEMPADSSFQALPQPSSRSQHSIPVNDSDGTDAQQTLQDASTETEVEAPLLGGHSDRNCRRRRWSQWNKRDPAAGRRRFNRACILIAVVIFVSIVVSTILNALIPSAWWSRTPLKPGQSFVPSGPDYERHETVDNIKGAYKLYDRIDISTTTGIIDIEIDPQPGHGPAYLILSSDLGSITVRLSPSYRPRRGHPPGAIHTEIRSFTGSVAADLLLGNGGSALVDTSTGVQFLSVLTYDVGYHDDASNLTTYSKTGSQSIQVAPLYPSSKAISNIHAEHHSFATATLNIVYPSMWEGEVFASSSAIGQVEVIGKDLAYVKQERGEVLAYRGKSRQRVNVISDGTGSASFKC